MKCEKYEFCPIYKRHGGALCSKLFRFDKCPPVKQMKFNASNQNLPTANETRLELLQLNGRR
jgi:hypothetical protein